MGMQAAYMLVDENALDRLVDLPGEDLADAATALEEEGSETAYLDKMWDGLHFALTGVASSDPIEDDPLSEAIVGVHVFDSDDYVGCTEYDELGPIIAALESVELDALVAALDFSRFADADIYPRIWTDDPVTLRAELSEAFAAVLDVHRRALAAGRHLVISIL